MGRKLFNFLVALTKRDYSLLDCIALLAVMVAIYHHWAWYWVMLYALAWMVTSAVIEVLVETIRDDQ